MKTYKKPEIKYENFSLSESVATGCSSDYGYWLVRGMKSVDTCYAESAIVPGQRFFLSHSNCDNKNAEMYCSTQMSDGSGASFSSY